MDRLARIAVILLATTAPVASAAADRLPCFSPARFDRLLALERRLETSALRAVRVHAEVDGASVQVAVDDGGKSLRANLPCGAYPSPERVAVLTAAAMAERLTAEPPAAPPSARSSGDQAADELAAPAASPTGPVTPSLSDGRTVAVRRPPEPAPSPEAHADLVGSQPPPALSLALGGMFFPETRTLLPYVQARAPWHVLDLGARVGTVTVGPRGARTTHVGAFFSLGTRAEVMGPPWTLGVRPGVLVGLDWAQQAYDDTGRVDHTATGILGGALALSLSLTVQAIRVGLVLEAGGLLEVFAESPGEMGTWLGAAIRVDLPGAGRS